VTSYGADHFGATCHSLNCPVLVSNMRRKTIAQGMFWPKKSLNINVVRVLCRRLCRDPWKLLIACKKFQRRPPMRRPPRPSDGGDVETTHGRGAAEQCGPHK
jgi:hypothetical protein